MTSHNPFQPPAAELGSIDRNRSLAPERSLREATRVQRFITLVVDTSITFVLMMAIFVVQVFAEDDDGRTTLGLFAYAAPFVYYVVCEGTTGRTVGKLLTRTKVIDLAGDHPSWGRIAWRSLLRLMPFDALSFLVANRGWHDRLSRTRVVQLGSGRKP